MTKHPLRLIVLLACSLLLTLPAGVGAGHEGAIRPHRFSIAFDAVTLDGEPLEPETSIQAQDQRGMILDGFSYSWLFSTSLLTLDVPAESPAGQLTGATFLIGNDIWSDYFMIQPGGFTRLAALAFFTGGPAAPVADVPEFRVDYEVPAGTYSLDLMLHFGVTFTETADDSTLQAETTTPVDVQVTDDFRDEGEIKVSWSMVGAARDVLRKNQNSAGQAELIISAALLFTDIFRAAPGGMTVISGAQLDLPKAALVESVVPELQGIVVIAQVPTESPAPLYAPQLTLEFSAELSSGAVLTPVDVPVEITWTIPGNVATPASVQIYRVVDGVATPLPTTVDVAAGAASASSPNSGTFVLVPARLLQVQLQAGTNRSPYTGAPGADPSILLNRLADPGALSAVFQFDGATQSWLSWRPGVLPILNSLKELQANAPLLLQLSRATTWDGPANPWAAGQWALADGFTASTFLGDNGTTPDDALARVTATNAVDAIFRFDATTQSWQSFRPGQPAFLNSIDTLNRFDVLMVLASTSTAWIYDAVNP